MLYPLLYLSGTDHVQTSVPNACKQINLGRFFLEMMRIVENTSKDVVHHILALCIVVQKYGGQTIHLPIMLSEQHLNFIFICHTPLYTHEHAVY